MNDASASSPYPLCLGCNYPLTGLSSNQCPECGQSFDHADAKTFNATGRAIGPLARLFLRPIGLPTLALSAFALGLLSYLTQPRALVFELSADEWGLYKPFLLDFPNWRTWLGDYRPRDFFFVTAAVLLVFAGPAFFLRTLLHAAVRFWHRPPRPLIQRRTVVSLLTFLCLVPAVTLLLFGAHYRIIYNRAQRELAKEPLSPALLRTSPRATGVGLLHLPTPQLRLVALKIAVEADHLDPALLRHAIARERDAALHATLLHAVALRRELSALDLLDQRLDHADPRIRAAAADAIGILHEAAYPIPNEQHWPNPSIATTPPITFSPSPGSTRFTEALRTLSPRYRQRLQAMMLSGPSPLERAAAARALRPWQVPEPQLRLAEWGVWLAGADGRMQFVESILDETPPFVHRTGNPIRSFALRRFRGLTFVTKPVIHLTASSPTVVDVQVLINGGRPYLAYPRPDDFAFEVDNVFKFFPGTFSLLDRFDRPALPSLYPLHEGYPWLLPPHRTVNGNRFTSAGVLWQSLIVTPQKLPMLTPAPVPSDPKYQWWSDLRQVESSWIARGDETERFLFYDGPTSLPPPLQATLTGDTLRFTRPQMTERPNPYPVTPPYFAARTARYGFLIRHKDGQLSSYRFPIPMKDEEAVSLSKLNVIPSANVESEFLDMLTDAGLTPSEAAGLHAAWKPHLFQTPGTRLLLFMSPADYDTLCPLTVRPAPTSIIRVGLVITEFSNQ